MISKISSQIIAHLSSYFNVLNSIDISTCVILYSDMQRFGFCFDSFLFPSNTRIQTQNISSVSLELSVLYWIHITQATIVLFAATDAGQME